MKKKIFLSLIITILLCISCKKEKQNLKGVDPIYFNKSDSKKKKNLVSTKLKSISDSLLFPTKILINKKSLIINDPQSKNSFHIISLPKEKYIGNYGVKGAGPGELLVSWRFSNSEKELMEVFDPQQKKIVEFDIDSLIIKNKFSKEYKLPLDIGNSSPLVYKNKIYSLYPDENEFILNEIDIVSKEIKKYGKPIEISSLDNYLKKEMFTADAYVSNDILVIAYLHIPQIEIFNLKNKQWKRIKGPDAFKPNFKYIDVRNGGKMVSQGKKHRYAFADVKIRGEYIYALYNGKNQKGLKGEHANKIFVYSFEGELVNEYTLDKSILSFDVYKNKYIYGINIEMIPLFLKFEL